MRQSSRRWRGSAKLETVRGVRRLIQNQPDPEYVLKPGFLEAMRLLPKYHLSFDVCIFHSQMPNTLDHDAPVSRRSRSSSITSARPGVKACLLDPWRAHIREMAALPNVVCKLSGVTTEADHKRLDARGAGAAPTSIMSIDCFGPDRILYGGDWPVSELAGGYLQWLATLDWATLGSRRADKRKLFRDNAVKAYRLAVDGRGRAEPARAIASRRLRAMARKRLPRMLFDMVNGAAGDEITMRRNEAALAAIDLAPKLLFARARRSATSRSSSSASGCRRRSSSARPVLRACCGRTPSSRRPARRRGSGRSTAASHASTSTIEEIGAATTGPKWMQVFLYKDRGLTAELAARAAAAGYKALILTVDNQVMAGRDRDARNRHDLSFALGP